MNLIPLLIIFSTIIPLLILNRLFKLKISVKMSIAAVRMALQLAFVGVYLKYIFKWNNPYINTLYLLVMIFIASVYSIRSGSLRLKPFLLPVSLSVALPQLLVLFLFNGLMAGKEHLFDARYMIPVGGMLLGNCLNGNIIALNRFYMGIKEDEKRYNYSLALGASGLQAAAPYLRKSLLAAIEPTIASLATTGLVALPGMMTGQILAGSLPITAIQYQAAIMISILTAKYLSILLSLLLTYKSGFNNFHILKKDIFRVSSS